MKREKDETLQLRNGFAIGGRRWHTTSTTSKAVGVSHIPMELFSLTINNQLLASPQLLMLLPFVLENICGYTGEKWERL